MFKRTISIAFAALALTGVERALADDTELTEVVVSATKTVRANQFSKFTWSTDRLTTTSL